MSKENALRMACTVALNPELVLTCAVLEDDFCTHLVPVEMEDVEGVNSLYSVEDDGTGL